MNKTFRLLFLLLLAFAFATTAFAQDIEIGDTIEDEADGDTVEYEIELEEGDSIEITLTSEDFDTYLFILDEDEDELDSNDDGFDSCCDSRLEFTAEEDGTYIIVVDAFPGVGDGGDGDFELTVEALDGGDDDDDDDDDGGSADVDFEYGDEEDFDVDGEDEFEITFEGEDGDVVTILATSEADQNLKLTLLDPDDDEIAIFDRFTFGAAALIRIPLEDDGVYTILIEERNGEELEDEVEVELIETEVLDLGDGPQTTEISSDVGLDYMVFEAEEDTVYFILITLDGDIDSSMDVGIFEEDDLGSFFPPVAIGFSGVEEAAFLFEASDDGIVTVELEYFGFGGNEVEVTVEITEQ